MQQRYGPFLTRLPEEHVMNIGDCDGYDPLDPESLLPYDPPRGVAAGRKKWRSSENWAPAIPLVMFFCFFVLWWFSFTVKIVSIGGKIATIRETDIPLLLNNTRLGIALLAAEAKSPVALVPQNFTATNMGEVQLVNTDPQNITVNNATAAQLVSAVTQKLTVNNVTEAQLASNRSQSLAAKNITEAQLWSKRSQNITANDVTKIQLASKQTWNLRANKFTAAQLVSKHKQGISQSSRLLQLNWSVSKLRISQPARLLQLNWSVSKLRISQPIMSLELRRRVQLP